MPSSRGHSQPRDQTQVSHIADGFLTVGGTREALQTDSHQQMVEDKTYGKQQTQQVEVVSP